MKRVAVVACMLVGSVATAQEDAPTLDDIAWLAGCWQGGGQGTEFDEHWMGQAGFTMLGMSRTVTEDKTVAYEFLRIHQEDDGIYYTSIPSGQTQASFKLVKCDDRSVEFENPDHDFPQHIIYRLEEDGALTATIKGNYKGAFKQVDFPMRRVQCK